MARGDVEPAGHAYPALQFPVHALETVPGTDPYRPAGQGPEHAGEGSPEVVPYVPAGHRVQDPEPAREYEPKGHAVALGDVDPGPHTYPALQLPEQTLLDRATTAPKVPAGQRLQAVAPLRLYFPRGHCTANGDVLPPGHAYPALQGPVQLGVARADALPKRPPGQALQSRAPDRL